MTSNWQLLLLFTIVCGLVIIPSGFASTQSRQIYGFVYSTTGQPISGASVSVSKCSYTQTATTGSDGSWQMIIPSDQSGWLTFSANGFQTQTFQIELNANWPYAGGVLSMQPTA